MDTPETVYRKLANRFSEVVAVVPDQAWDQPSPCEGWTARGVLEHVIGAEADFVEQRGLALSPPGPSPASEPVSAWDHVRSQIQTILDDPERAGIVYEGHFGSTTIGQAIEDFYCFDLIVHRWDIAEATGGDTEISRCRDRLRPQQTRAVRRRHADARCVRCRVGSTGRRRRTDRTVGLHRSARLRQRATVKG